MIFYLINFLIFNIFFFTSLFSMTNNSSSSSSNSNLSASNSIAISGAINDKTKEDLKLNCFNYEPKYTLLDVVNTQEGIQKIIAGYISDEWVWKLTIPINGNLNNLYFLPESKGCKLVYIYNGETKKTLDLKTNKTDTEMLIGNSTTFSPREYSLKYAVNNKELSLDILIIPGRSHPYPNFVFSQCAKYLAISNTEREVDIIPIDAPSNSITIKYNTPTLLKAQTNVMLFSSDLKYLFAATLSYNINDPYILIWNINNIEQSNLAKEIQIPIDDEINKLIASPCGKYLAFFNDLELGILDLKTNKSFMLSDTSNDDSDENNNNITNVVFTKCGNYLISATNCILKIWQINPAKILHVLDKDNSRHSSAISSLAISPCGNYFASASEKEIIIWQNKSNKILENIGLPAIDSF